MKKISTLILSLFFMGMLFADPMDYWTGTYKFLKDNKTTITDDMAIDFMYVTNRNDYNKFKNDEFEWEDAVARYKKQYEENVKNSSLGEYNVVTKAEFGKYDSEKGGYIVTLGTGTFFPSSEGVWRAPKGTLKEIGIVPKDLEKFNLIPMEKEAAKTFLNERKSNSGYIDREVLLLINFDKILDCTSAEYKTYFKKWDTKTYNMILASIKSIDVYDKKGIEKIGELIKK